ncbi:MAG: acyl-CoA dehydrogenase [Planctomycetota bacterium]|jgi:acyl-CoA dehydrogenase
MSASALDVLEGLRAKARAVGLEHSAAIAEMEEEPAARAALAALSAAGLIAWCVPARDGGADTSGLAGEDSVSVRALSALRDELAWHSPMLDVMLVMQGLGSYAVARAGSAVLRSDVLPGVVSGNAIAAFGLTEPGAGSSLADVSTRAEKTAAGWRLSGHKTFISNCGIARFYSVLARTSGEPGDKDGLSMFFVPADVFGVECEPFEVMAPHPIGDVHFHDVELPADFLLGEEGAGMELALSVLARFRTSVAAAANGFSRRALDESVKHLKSREQFGRPLSSFQGLRFDLAEMDVRLRAAQLLVNEAADLSDREDPRADHAVARAKLYATESAGYICDRAVQHHGGLGVKRGTTVEHLYRDVRALRIYEGASEVQKLILASKVLA